MAQKIGDVMTKDISTCKVDDQLSDCANKMREMNVGFMPVVDQDWNLVGVLTDRDIAIRAVAKGADVNNSLVRDFMTPNPITVESDYDVEDAANIMADSQIRRLVVLDNGKVAGIVSLGDLAVDVGEAEPIAETFEKISEPVR